jgi:hypothetical protein
MKQRWLPEFDYPDVDEAQPGLTTGDVGADTDESLLAPVLPGQRQLFTAERELIGQLEAALASGQFEDARRCRDALVGLEGPSSGTRDLTALDTVGDQGFWQRPLAVVLSEWLDLDSHLVDLPYLRQLIHDGALSRLLELYRPAELVRAEPSLLARLTNRLGATVVDDGIVAPDTARLVRDALLDGCETAPGDFDDDRLVDLLAEDQRPIWLACLGALRHLWPVPPAGPAELTLACSPIPDDEDERGREFWVCLQCAIACGRDEPTAVAARKRMKLLHPDMHALFMRDGVVRE